MKAYILRGLPGSGKSTFTNNTLKGVTICSADQYFMVDGEYHYDGTKIGNAHKASLKKFVDALTRGEDVVCDNTNCSHLEAAPYVAVAAAMGAEVEIHTFLVPPSVSIERNTHGVPANAIHGMNERLLRSFSLPAFWRDHKHTVHGTAPGYPTI
jgi:predicted kinase